jgi:large-conductance mechanosensitive channel
MASNGNSSIFNFELEELKQFIVDNSVIGTTAGVCIALVTKDLISSLVGDIIIPSIILICITLNISALTKILPGKSSFDFTNFFKQFISWFFVLIVTFIFIKVSFGYFLDTSGKKIEKKDDTKTKESFFSY